MAGSGLTEVGDAQKVYEWCNWSKTSPHFSSRGEMITQRSGLMTYIPVIHPFGFAARSKFVPDGFVTVDFLMERKTDCLFDDVQGSTSVAGGRRR